MKTIPTALPLALAATALLLAPLGAAAQDAGQVDRAWASEPRSLDVRSHDAGFTFTSSRDSALGSDLLSGGFDARSAQLALALRAEEPDPGAVRMDLAWTRLVEYRDLDGDGRYGLADETVQSFGVPGLPYQASVAPTLAPSGGRAATIVYTLPANESDPDPVIGGGLPEPRGTLTLTFTLVPATSSVTGLLRAPTELAVRTEVRDFPYAAGGTALALATAVATDAPALEVGTGTPESAEPQAVLAARSAQLSWSAAWATDAEDGGAARPAGWSTLATDASHATAVLSLPRGDAVSHDGSVAAHRWQAGVAQALRDLPPGDALLYAAGLAGAAILVGVPSIRRLRER